MADNFNTAWRAEVVDDATVLAMLAPAWQRLFAEAAAWRPSPALRHGYVALALRHLPATATPFIITVWQADRLVLAWPLAIRREAGLRVARPLGCGNDEDYSGPLIAGDTDPTALLDRALSVLRPVADCAWLFNLLAGTAVTAALARAGLWRAAQPILSPIVRCGQAGDMAAWRQTKSRNFRSGLANDRRRLARMGRLESIIVTPEQGADFAAWFFATKCRWLDGRGIGDNWLRRPECRAFFADALADPAGTGMFATALRLDDAWIAGSMCLDGDTIEYLSTTYDEALAARGPGSLAYEDVVAHGVATGRDVDMRITGGGYKLRWADADEARTTLLVALTPLGMAPVLRFALRLQIKAVRRRLGSLRRRLQR